MSKREIADAVAKALEIMLRMRQCCVYRSAGWWLLNRACVRLDAAFWDEMGEPRPQSDKELRETMDRALGMVNLDWTREA